MTKTRTAGRIGRRKTLQKGGLFGIPSLRKRIMTQPSEYKKIIAKYLGETIRTDGKRPLSYAEFPDMYKLPMFPTTDDSGRPTGGTRFTALKKVWEEVAAAYKALVRRQVQARKNVNAEIPKNITDPRMKAAIISGATAGALTTMGVAGTVVAQTGLFVASVACVGVAVAFSVFITFVELGAFVCGGAFAGIDFTLTSAAWASVTGCNFMKEKEDPRDALLRGGGATKEEIAAAEAERVTKDSLIQNALVDAAEELMPLQKAFDDALAKGISGTQDVFGGMRWGDYRVNKVLDEALKSFPELLTGDLEQEVKQLKPGDVATMMAVAAVSTASTPETKPDEKEENTPEANAAEINALVKVSDPMPKAPPAAAAPTAAPTAAPAPAEAAPAPAPEGKCWTKKVDGDDTWFVRDKESVWDLYKRRMNPETGKEEKTGEVIGTECGTGGRRRPTRGGDGDRPKYPKPSDAVAGRRRKTRRTLRPFRRSTRGRRR